MISLISVVCLSEVAAAPPSAIGVIKSTGEFRVDGSTIRGNSTVFDGSVIETTAARSEVQLTGLQITLSPDSRIRVYRDHTVLEHGSGLLKDVEKQVVEAETLRIAPATKASIVQVEIGPSGVELVARVGSAEVRNASGVLVASLHTGVALALDPQAGASAAVKMTGVVVFKNGKYFLTDVTSNVTVELEGPDVAKFAGKMVEIAGSVIPSATPAAPASELVSVANIRAKAAAAGTGGVTAAAGGLSKGATIAIVGGVGVGGTVIGLEAAGTFSGGTSVSRQ
jgi:hypothetical protein